MSEEDWTIVSKATVNKWDDEEDSDVKENWDDEEEEDSKASSTGDQATSPQPPPVAKAPTESKKKKNLKKKLMQKELEEQQNKPKTQEELLAEKLERQRLQQESDLDLAKDAFGIGSAGDPTILSGIQLGTRNDFEAFQKALSSKLSSYTRSPHYVPFLEDLFRDLAAGLEADDIKKLDTVLTTLFNEKIKLQKQAKGKKTKKSAQIQMERDDDYSYNHQSNYNDFDDFL